MTTVKVDSPFPCRLRRSRWQRCRRASWSTRMPSTPRLHHSRCCRSPRCSPPASAGTRPAGNLSGEPEGEGQRLESRALQCGGQRSWRHKIFSQRTQRSVDPWCKSRVRPRKPASYVQLQYLGGKKHCWHSAVFCHCFCLYMLQKTMKRI